jgi:hypothetical protein
MLGKGAAAVPPDVGPLQREVILFPHLRALSFNLVCVFVSLALR